MTIDPAVASVHSPGRLLLMVLAVSVAGGCLSGGGESVDDWSRSYLSTYDRVFEAALDAVEDSGFYLDTVDEERGRIRAEASARRGDEMSLIIDVGQRADRIRVDVMAQGAAAQDGRGPGPIAPVVAEYLRNLDARLEGRLD